MEKQVPTLEALNKLSQELIALLTPGETATFITLSGELGAGKTTLTQHLAQALGIAESVTSPTFVLEKIYELSHSAFLKFIHIDAYRLTGGKDLDALNFEELLSEPTNLIVLEWPEKVADALPTPTIAIGLTPHEDGSRTVTYIYAKDTA